MTNPKGRTGTKAPKPAREDRLKAALKANMAKRKAQARARSDEGQERTPGADDQAGDGAGNPVDP